MYLLARNGAETTSWLGTSSAVGWHRRRRVAPVLPGQRCSPAPEALGPYVRAKMPRQGFGVETVQVLTESSSPRVLGLGLLLDLRRPASPMWWMSCFRRAPLAAELGLVLELHSRVLFGCLQD